MYNNTNKLDILILLDRKKFHSIFRLCNEIHRQIDRSIQLHCFRLKTLFNYNEMITILMYHNSGNKCLSDSPVGVTLICC